MTFGKCALKKRRMTNTTREATTEDKASNRREIAYVDRAAKGALPLNGTRTRYSVQGKPGLVLDVQPGDPIKRRWYVRYQVGKGSGRRQGYDLIGDTAHWSIAQAWEFASKTIREARGGIDPVAIRAAEAAEDRTRSRTVDEVFDEWLDNPGRKRELAPRTRVEKGRVYNKHVRPDIGSTPIAKLDKGVISNLLDGVREATTDEARGFRGAQARIARQIIHAICAFAVDHEYIDHNPCRAVAQPVPEKNPKGKQHRALTDDELRRIWTDAPSHVPPMYVRLFRLALLTGRRRSELAGIMVAEVELSMEPLLTIPADREGNKTREMQLVPLSPSAAAILREQIGASGESPFVFQPRSLRQKPVDKHEASRRWRQLCKDIGIADAVRLHDTRTLIVNHFSRMGVPREYHSHVLSHSGDIRRMLAGRDYNEYEFLTEKRRALELWEGRLLEIVEGRQASGLRW